MASLQKTYSGDLTQSIAKQLWSARQEASGAKREALGILEESDDPMLHPGEFMGHAVMKRMTSMLPRSLQHQMPDLKGSEYLHRGQSRSLMSPFASPINPQPTEPWYGPSGAGGGGINPDVVPNDAILGDMINITPTAGKTDGIKVHDQKLGKFVSEVAISLSGSMGIINKRMDSVDEGVISAKDGLSVTQKQLEDNGTLLEDKLDAIIALLRYQKEEMAQMEDEAEVDAVSTEQGKEQKLFGSGDIAGVDESVDDTVQRDPSGNDFQWDNNLSPMRQPGEFEEGGMPIGNINRLHGREIDDRGRVYDGPDTGYLANTAGASAIAPINNFFTRGQTGAASKNGGGKPTEGREVDIESIPEVRTEIEKLQLASVLPLQAAGAMTMGILEKSLPFIPVVGPVAYAIKQMATPIASMFGVKNSITTNISSDIGAKEDEKKRRASTASGEPVRAMEDKMRNEDNQRAWWDFLGWAGTGKKKGTGGADSNTSITQNTRKSIGGVRSSTNIKSNTSIGGSKQNRNTTNNKGGVFETISNFFSLAKDKDHKVSDETTMGNTINQMQLKRYIMEHGEFPPGYQGGTGGAFGGGNLGESAYGGSNTSVNVNDVTTPPASQSRFVNLSERSKESTFTKVAQANQKMEPIVINNASSKTEGTPQELEHISNVGDPGLDIIYPSMV